MNINQLKFRQDNMKYQKRVIETGCWRCCLNCNIWYENKCTKYNQTPPPETIVVGCEHYEYYVPF